MSRKAKIISLEEFKEKCEKVMRDNWFPDTPAIAKDIAKIEFDCENVEWQNGQGFMEYPCGYEVLSNGLPVLFVNAGGDWETPICFCIYWNGKSLRGYIPDKGNVYNRKFKSAYGNNEDEEEGEKAKEDADQIRLDIVDRVKIII